MPTVDQRALVENAAAIGITQAEIANQLKIDEKTLRKHFRDELSSGKFKIDTSTSMSAAVMLLSRAMPMLHNGTARRDRRNRKQC